MGYAVDFDQGAKGGGRRPEPTGADLDMVFHEDVMSEASVVGTPVECNPCAGLVGLS
jgi:hypothetical protein